MDSTTVEVGRDLLKCRSVRWKAVYDEKNFLYCVMRHLWSAVANIDHFKHFPSKYERRFNLEGVTFPLTFNRINNFVQKNKHLPMTIRVFFESEEQVCVLDTFSNIKGKRKRFKKVLNLLMIKSDQEIPSCKKRKKIDPSISSLKSLNHQHHFFTIKNLRSFLNSRRQVYSDVSSLKSYHYCEVCLMNFCSEKKRNSHRKICQRDKQSVVYPSKGSVLNFSKQRNAFKAPVIGFADFECFMEEYTDEKLCNKCNKTSIKCDCEKSSNQMLNKHKACGFSICFVDSDNDVFYQETYSGDDAVEVFLKKLSDYEDVVNERKQRFRHTSQIKASNEEWRDYHEATHCHICEKIFDDSRMYRKVVDHDHVSGGNIRAAHSICNLQHQGPHKTPIYFHNGQG